MRVGSILSHAKIFLFVSMVKCVTLTGGLSFSSSSFFVILSLLFVGGDVGPLGEQAVTDLHSLFTWARSSTKGLMLFIDEAEAFLGSRSRAAHTVHMRNALNALLFQTGDQSKHFMLVLATNRAADLDAAVLDRIDEAVHFALPGSKERLNIASQYFNEHVLNRSPSLTNDVWYKGGGVVSMARKGIDALLCGQGATVFGPGLIPSKQIVLKEFERCGEGRKGRKGSKSKSSSSARSSDTEEFGEGSDAGGVDESEGEDEDGVVSRLSRKGTSAGRKGRSKTPVRKSTQKKKMKKKKKQKGRNESTGGHYHDLRKRMVDIDCPAGTVDGIEFFMRKTASATASFSGRQLAKMMISCQGAIYGTADSCLTPDTYWKLVQRKVEEHQRKQEMAAQKEGNDGGNQYNYA